MRTEQEILNDINKVEEELKSKYGTNTFGSYNFNYINDENGNVILDPEEEALLDRLEELEREYRSCGYGRNDIGEYSGSSNGL